MKILTQAPEHAVYLGSEHGDGSIEPAAYRDDDSVEHYFDLFQD